MLKALLDNGYLHFLVSGGKEREKKGHVYISEEIQWKLKGTAFNGKMHRPYNIFSYSWSHTIV